MVKSKDNLRHQLYVIIFGTHTKAGRTFDLFLIVAIIASLTVLILESIPEIRAQWRNELRMLERRSGQ